VSETVVVGGRAVAGGIGSRGVVAPNRKRIATNVLSLSVTYLLGFLATIGISIYVRRILGPEAVGQVNWVQAALGFGAILINPGLTTVGQRELARDRKADLPGLIVTLQTLLAALAVAVCLVCAALGALGRVRSLLLAIQAVGLLFVAWNLGWVLQAHERMVAPSFANLAFNALQLPLFLPFVHGPADVYWYAGLGLSYPGLMALFTVWYVARHRLVAAWRIGLAGARALLAEAWPLALAQGAGLVFLYADTLILGVTDGDEAVGQYSTAYRLMMVSAFVTASLWNAYFPVLARSREAPAQAVRLSREYLGLLAWSGFPIAALGWAVGRHVVAMMYGPAFAEAGRLFEWLCLAVALQFVNHGLSQILVPWGYGRIQFRIVAWGAVANIAANLAIIPLWGAWGAVATTIGSEALVLVLGLSARRRHDIFRHPVLPLIVPPLLCSAAVALAIAALPETWDARWWAALAAGTAVLALCLLWFERRVIGTLLHRGA
jgi:PST family polysaccharide transporter